MFLSLVSSCTSPTRPTRYYQSCISLAPIYNRAPPVFARSSLPPVSSPSQSLITAGSIKLMSLFVQFFKTYGPETARGGQLGAPDWESPNLWWSSMLMLSWCRKGGIMKYFYGEFQWEIINTNSAIFFQKYFSANNFCEEEK